MRSPKADAIRRDPDRTKLARQFAAGRRSRVPRCVPSPHFFACSDRFEMLRDLRCGARMRWSIWDFACFECQAASKVSMRAQHLHVEVVSVRRNTLAANCHRQTLQPSSAPWDGQARRRGSAAERRLPRFPVRRSGTGIGITGIEVGLARHRRSSFASRAKRWQLVSRSFVGYCGISRCVSFIRKCCRQCTDPFETVLSFISQLSVCW